MLQQISIYKALQMTGKVFYNTERYMSFHYYNISTEQTTLIELYESITQYGT